MGHRTSDSPHKRRLEYTILGGLLHRTFPSRARLDDETDPAVALAEDVCVAPRSRRRGRGGTRHARRLERNQEMQVLGIVEAAGSNTCSTRSTPRSVRKTLRRCSSVVKSVSGVSRRATAATCRRPMPDSSTCFAPAPSRRARVGGSVVVFDDGFDFAPARRPAARTRRTRCAAPGWPRRASARSACATRCRAAISFRARCLRSAAWCAAPA